MQETNKLSNDDTYLVVRDNGGQTLVHTDTFAEQKGFAKLATDAAGVVGMSAGNVADIFAASGVGRSPQSTDMRLTQKSGVIYCGGVPIREIGVCSYDLFINYITSGNTSFITEFRLMAEYGIRFCRVILAPYWKNDWNTYYAADKTAYYKKLTTFLNAASEAGIGIIGSMFWRFATLADIAGESVSLLGTPGSACRALAQTMLTEYAQRYSAHPALAAWEVGNEYNLFAYNGSIPTTSVGNGTPASYASPADVLTIAGMRDFYAFFYASVTAVDTSGRLVLTGNGGPTGGPSRTIATYKDAIRDDNPVNSVSLHKYSRNAFGNRSYAALYDLLCAARKVAFDAGKPLILGEFGMERNETYGGYGGDGVFRTACRAIHAANVQLALVWNWRQNSETVSANNFDIHPLNTVNGMSSRFEIVAEWNARMRADGYSAVLPSVTTPDVRGGQYVSVPANAAQAALLTVSDAAVLKPTAFAIAFWFKNNRDDLTFRRIARKYGGNAGWQVLLDNSSVGKRVYFQIQKSDGATQNTNTQTDVVANGEWTHYVFELNPTSGQATSGINGYVNGEWIFNLPFSGTWNPSTDSLLFFADAGPSSPSYSALKDFQLFNRALTDDEVRALYLRGAVPTGTLAGEWKFDGNYNDSSGNANHAILTAGAPVFGDFPL